MRELFSLLFKIMIALIIVGIAYLVFPRMPFDQSVAWRWTAFGAVLFAIIIHWIMKVFESE